MSPQELTTSGPRGSLLVPKVRSVNTRFLLVEGLRQQPEHPQHVLIIQALRRQQLRIIFSGSYLAL